MIRVFWLLFRFHFNCLKEKENPHVTVKLIVRELNRKMKTIPCNTFQPLTRLHQYWCPLVSAGMILFLVQ